MSDTINYRMYAMPDNNHYKYIMVLIDVFTKRAYAAPMKRMKDFDASIAMESMINKLPDLPKSIITDLGTEYYNSKMTNLFDRFEFAITLFEENIRLVSPRDLSRRSRAGLKNIFGRTRSIKKDLHIDGSMYLTNLSTTTTIHITGQ